MQKKTLNNKLQTPAKRDFFNDVFDVVKLIPEGRVTTYGAIANFLGSKSSARLVGWALGASHNSSLYIPAHRVVNRIGMLSGRMQFENPDTMEQCLVSEGIKIKDNQVQDFEILFWDPFTELSL